MAHFAKLDDENIVLQVIVINNAELLDENGNESEAKGIEFCQSLFNGNWKQTSYNGNIRKNFAGIGYKYDETKDAFIAPKPFESWLLDESTCTWQPPVAYPTDDKLYRWEESTVSWVEVTF
jgi:hypothetical protein